MAAKLLLELLRGPLVEAEIIANVDGLEQSTCNRRLHRLAEAGLAEQEPGTPQAPHRHWKLLHAPETEAVLTAILALADAIDTRNRRLRDRSKRSLRKARAARLGIRLADDRRAAQ